MKLARLLALPSLLLLVAGCTSTASRTHVHWNYGERFERTGYFHALGFLNTEHESYGAMLKEDAGDVWLTLRRHFGNSNPDNPFQHFPDSRFPDVGKPTPPAKFRVNN